MESIVECEDEEEIEEIPCSDPWKYLREKQNQEAQIYADRKYVAQMQSEFATLLDPFRDEFSLFLRSFQQGALHVGPAQEDLQGRCIRIYSSFGVDITRIIATTPDRVDRALTRYKTNRKAEERMDAKFLVDMTNAISRNDIGYAMCSDLYDAALKHDWHAAVFSEDRFTPIVIDGKFNRLGRAMGLRVRDLATAYMYLRVMRVRDFETRVKAFLDLYLQGNYPVRILKNNILLIATA